MTTLTEAEVEAVLLDQLGALGHSCLNDAISGPDGSSPEREAYSDTFLASRLRDAISRLNPHIPRRRPRGCFAQAACRRATLTD